MAGTGKPSIVAAAAFVVACGLAALAPTAAMAQFPFMIPNFNLAARSITARVRRTIPPAVTRTRSEDKAPEKVDKSKEKDATQPDSTPTTSTPRTQQTSGPPPSHDAAPSGGSGTPASPPPAPPAKRTTTTSRRSSRRAEVLRLSSRDPPVFCPSAARIRSGTAPSLFGEGDLIRPRLSAFVA